MGVTVQYITLMSKDCLISLGTAYPYNKAVMAMS